MAAQEVDQLMQAELLDSSYSGVPWEHEDKTAVHVARIGSEKVQISIRWNSYDFQSSAKVSLLTPEKTWTVLATEPPEGWHKSIPVYRRDIPVEDMRKALDSVAAKLLVRARNILA